MCFQDGTRTIDSFVEDSLVEYLDVNEENDALVCFSLITS